MSVRRAADGRREQVPGLREERRTGRTGFVGTGSLACPVCDAPAPLLRSPAEPATPLGCPYCSHTGAVRDFLSLASPPRAPRVRVYASLRL
jgi:hypothetical protein